MAADPSKLLAGDVFFLDEFAVRQWDDPSYSGTRLHFDKAEFLERVHHHHAQGAKLVDGYAAFCKHVFIPNDFAPKAKVGALQITDKNRHLLQSGYSKRRPEELAVLTRWFRERDVEVPDAQYLDVILYSREQLIKEYEAMPTKGDPQQLPRAPWGIISIKAQAEDYETPMQPITIMRNSLGAAEGGSGVPLDKAAYDASVAYWDRHAAIVVGAKPSGE
ncbi:hypothetical protein WJX72_010616 [[Myrmecia] bisecta]|uniref:Flagellar associated protein n=1 Tax=[Myrmecia] bisecta TaxID=41462 RepID=A0AAW1PDE3_9CHLO